ncbi:DUF427 domain-containing protein [Phycicoccus sp. CSK15P-2]|uniref:DUF427 domain-containing protein n=1 Tax=Phycicoccus sp. CSK15P-2 TaxID=2807627 RepID=UPI0019529F51|nr:DUF427 domain-containing protein [Phycicoccus sp. CSK15P-2]MBM6405907.1 DUF427 domain-containing protein [Phycicoccus sp. CSK15P-2]
MALTLPPGPLSASPGPANFTVDGPAHKVLLTPLAKRVRVLVGDGAGDRRTLVDTTGAMLLHETGLLPRYYVPVTDVDPELLGPSDTTSHCPFKGDATYSHVRAGARTVPDLLWFYRDPQPELPGLAGLYLERLDTLPPGARAAEDAGSEPLDAVLEEDEPVLGHPRDPYHRVDAWPSSRHVVVTWEPEGRDPVVLADTTGAVGVFETALPARWYVPEADVRTDLLEPSGTRTVCPYKGVAEYRSVVGGPVDAAWLYPAALPEAAAATGMLCFLGEGLVTTVDGERVPA